MGLDITPLFPTLIILIAAFLVTLYKCGSVVTPFLICNALFIGEVLFSFLPAMAPYGRINIGALSEETVGILTWGSLGLLICSFALRQPSSYTLTNFSVEPKFSGRALVMLFLLICFLASAYGFARLGTFPIFFMSHSDIGRENIYEEVYAGFITFLGWGASRSLGYWALMELAVWPGSLAAFLRNKKVLVGATLIGVVLTTLDGQRSTFVTLALATVFLLSLRGGLSLVKVVLLFCIGVVFFVVVGNWRLGTNDLRMRLADPPENAAVGFMWAWLVTYLEPNISNLNNSVALIQTKADGGIFFSQILPDSLLTSFMDVPPSAVQQLNSAGLLAFPGLTYRTAYADWYADFGSFGAVILVVGIYAAAVFAFRRAAMTPIAMLTYLQFTGLIFFLPLMNIFVGIPALLPLSLFFLLRFTPRSKKSFFPYS